MSSGLVLPGCWWFPSAPSLHGGRWSSPGWGASFLFSLSTGLLAVNVELSPPGGEEWICVSIGGRTKSTHWRRSWCHLWPCYTFDSWNKHITGKVPVVAEVCNDKLWATPPPGRYLLYKASNGFSNSHIYPVSLYLVVLLMQLSSLPLNSR